jgi:hypothetical protein
MAGRGTAVDPATLITGGCTGVPGPASAYTGRRYPSAGQSDSEMSLIRRPGRRYRARTAEPLQPGRDLAAGQARIVAAVVADELKQGWMATIRPAAMHGPGRLAPQDRPEAVAGLPGSRTSVYPWPGATGIISSG